MKTLTFHISKGFDGTRLDKALQAFFPELSMRDVKLLWEKYHVHVQGKKISSGQKGRSVYLNDCVTLTPKTADKNTSSSMVSTSSLPSPEIISTHEDWLFFHKPRGLHSAHVTGGARSLEDWLATQEHIYGKLFLCNRLDAQTSGIVVAARTLEALNTWHEMEDAGLCQKRYLALVTLPHDTINKICITAQLDTDKRKISRVLETEAEALRHSYFNPLYALSQAEYAALRAFFPLFPEQSTEQLGLMGCVIYKGARHQIRAHAAHAGFALFNDVRYTKRQVPDDECFLLHHGSLHFDGHSININAPWQSCLEQKTLLKHFWQQK